MKLKKYTACLMLLCIFLTVSFLHPEYAHKNDFSDTVIINEYTEIIDHTYKEASSTDATSDEIRKKYEEAKTISEADRNTAKRLLEEIQDINNQIALNAVFIEQTGEALAGLDADIELSEKKIQLAEDEMIARREELCSVLSLVYETSSGEEHWAQILKTGDMYDVINRGEYVNSFSKYVEGKLSDLTDVSEMVREEKEILLEKKSEKESDIRELEEKQAQLQESISQLAALKKEADKKAEDAGAIAEELRQQMVALEAKEQAALYNRDYDGSLDNVDYSGNGTDYYYASSYPYTQEELVLMAAVIQAEAGGYSYPGMIAVGSVIMNRLSSPNFANTLTGVIYAPGQFEPVGNGRVATIIANGPVESCMAAAKDVLEGKRNIPYYYFKAAWWAEQHGVNGINIGGNVFHK